MIIMKVLSPSSARKVIKNEYDNPVTTMFTVSLGGSLVIVKGAGVTY